MLSYYWLFVFNCLGPLVQGVYQCLYSHTKLLDKTVKHFFQLPGEQFNLPPEKGHLMFETHVKVIIQWFGLW